MHAVCVPLRRGLTHPFLFLPSTKQAHHAPPSPHHATPPPFPFLHPHCACLVPSISVLRRYSTIGDAKTSLTCHSQLWVQIGHVPLHVRTPYHYRTENTLTSLWPALDLGCLASDRVAAGNPLCSTHLVSSSCRTAVQLRAVWSYRCSLCICRSASVSNERPCGQRHTAIHTLGCMHNTYVRSIHLPPSSAWLSSGSASCTSGCVPLGWVPRALDNGLNRQHVRINCSRAASRISGGRSAGPQPPEGSTVL